MKKQTNTITEQTTSTGALLAVADKIESDPDSWDQSNWSNLSVPGMSDISATASAHSCGTAGCIAGWGVATLPDGLGARITRVFGGEWEQMGQVVFGLDEDLANWLFSGSLGENLADEVRQRRVVKVIRKVAATPERNRSFQLIDRLQKILDTGR